jgi:hypothetical protein
MIRYGCGLLVLSTMLLSVAPAEAQWFDNFCQSVKRGYHRNMSWPEPFLRADRESATLPFGIMVSNGWRRQNLLSDYHFNDDSPQLNQAGELKLHFILTQMPPNRRTVFVQRAMNPELTAVRMAVVQRAADRMLPSGMIAEVVESDLPNDGWPADEIDSVSRQYQRTRPDPRLPSNDGGSGGGSGGSGGGK